MFFLLMILNNKITDSSEYFLGDVSRLILPTDFNQPQDILEEDLLLLISIIKKLPIFPREQFNIVDLDNTIYTRYHTLQLSLLNENRGDAGNKVIRDKMGGYYNFCQRFYKKNQAIPEFMDMLKNRTSLILTAGKKDLQDFKLSAIGYGIEKAEKIVVDKDYMKPIYALFYIINNLGFIPGKINIYDDRVKFFNKYAPLLSKILQTDINVNEVLLSQYKTNRIDSISQTTYSGSKIMQKNIKGEFID